MHPQIVHKHVVNNFKKEKVGNETAVVIGRNLKAIREKLGFNQENLADILGISRTNIAHFESGKRMIPIVHIPKIAAFLGVKPIDLLVEDETQIELNQVFAFKADNLNRKDVLDIAKFKQIVCNFLELEKKSNK